MTRQVMTTPRRVHIELTSQCNLRCLYCSHFTSASDGVENLDYRRWLTFFEELKDCAVLEVTLSGGEPLCYPYFQEIIEGIVANQMQFSILTNGTLLTDDIAQSIAETKRCKYVQVSIDGSCSEIHDAVCGNGSFDAAVQGIRYLKAAHIPTTVRMTLTRINLHDIENTTRFLLEDLELPSFSTNSASYIGQCRGAEKELMLTRDEESLAMEILLNLSERYPGRIQGKAGPLAQAVRWPEMVRAFQNNESPFSNGGALTACGCVWSEINIRPDGVMTPCAQIPHLELGTINQDSLRDIWQNHPVLMAFRERYKISLNEFERCRNCSYIHYCTGSCPATAYNYTGNLNMPSPDACLKLFLEEGGQLADANLYAVS